MTRAVRIVFVLGLLIGAGHAFYGLPWPDRIPASEQKAPTSEEIKKIRMIESLANQSEVDSLKQLDRLKKLNGLNRLGDLPNPFSPNPSATKSFNSLNEIQELVNKIPSLKLLELSEFVEPLRGAVTDPLADIKAKNSPQLEAGWSDGWRKNGSAASGLTL